jgi:hypothetical protein
VEVIGRADGDRVDLVQAQESFVVGNGPGNAEVLRDEARLLGVVVADRHDLDIPPALQGGKVVYLGDEPHPDDAEAEGKLGHGAISRKRVWAFTNEARV